MNPLRATVNWGHVAVRAAFYGPISCSIGTLAPNNHVSRWAMKRWCIGASNGLGIRRELLHGERLGDVDQCVYVANHLSLLDILVIGSYLDADYRWLAKSPLFHVPFMGWHLRLSGHIPVYRGEQRRLNSALPERIHSVVAEGASLLFFPEGTRSPDGRLRPFRDGAFRAAVDENLPVVPLVLRGTGELMEKGALDLAVDHSRKCTLTVLPPVYPTTGLTRDEAIQTLRESTLSVFSEELGEMPSVEPVLRQPSTLKAAAR